MLHPACPDRISYSELAAKAAGKDPLEDPKLAVERYRSMGRDTQHEVNRARRALVAEQRLIDSQAATMRPKEVRGVADRLVAQFKARDADAIASSEHDLGGADKSWLSEVRTKAGFYRPITSGSDGGASRVTGMVQDLAARALARSRVKAREHASRGGEYRPWDQTGLPRATPKRAGERKRSSFPPLNKAEGCTALRSRA